MLVAPPARRPHKLLMPPTSRVARAIAECGEEECEFILELLEGFCSTDEDIDAFSVVATDEGSRVAQALLARLRRAARLDEGAPCA